MIIQKKIRRFFFFFFLEYPLTLSQKLNYIYIYIYICKLWQYNFDIIWVKKHGQATRILIWCDWNGLPQVLPCSKLMYISIRICDKKKCFRKKKMVIKLWNFDTVFMGHTINYLIFRHDLKQNLQRNDIKVCISWGWKLIISFV